MLKKLKNIFYISFFLIFFLLTIIYYLSEKNIKKTYKSRSTYSINLDMYSLPLLKNDTNNIIEYSDDIEIFKKEKKRYKFWELLKSK